MRDSKDTNNKFKFKKSWIGWILVGLVGILAWTSYNGMVGLEEQAKSQWAHVESSYQRRADLIPNLVSTVKGYAAHEKETLTEVVNARAKATSMNVNVDKLDASAIKKFQAAQDGLSSALSKLMVVVEKYPDLKANQNFLELQAQLEGTENRINTERNRFSKDAKEYNNKIKKLPGKLFNMLYGFEEISYFESAEGSDVAPEVSFE